MSGSPKAQVMVFLSSFMISDHVVPYRTRKAVNKDLTIIALEKELSSKLMTVVCINQSKRAGKIEIKFATKEELNRLVSILMVTKD